MNWVIGGITITIGVLMAVFAVVQFVYQRKIQKEEIGKLEGDLSKKIDSQLSEKELALITVIEERIGITEKDLTHKINLMNADIDRRFALDCAEDGMPHVAFDWWVSAAARYAETNSTQMRSTAVKEAKDEIGKVKEKYQIDGLLEYTSNITENLAILRKKHPIEADLLAELFKKKIEST